MRICPICSTQFDGADCPKCMARLIRKSRVMRFFGRLLIVIAFISASLCTFSLLSQYYASKGALTFMKKNPMRPTYVYVESQMPEEDFMEEIENTPEGKADRVSEFGLLKYAIVDAKTASEYQLPEGFMIVEVAPGSPAANAGLVPGDVILSADGKQVQYATDLVIAIYSSENSEITLGVFRQDGNTYDIKVSF